MTMNLLVVFLGVTCSFGRHVRALSLSTPVKKAKVKYVFNSPSLSSQRGYVPDGLTEEEYRKIKDEERALLQSKNFGAWGPRFKQVGGETPRHVFSDFEFHVPSMLSCLKATKASIGLVYPISGHTAMIRTTIIIYNGKRKRNAEGRDSRKHELF
mmetsp:Transcript_35987/g.85785  ORF Transcript_35987/g.85785 Transcript_35987/m.85785 type:complete len:155 (-) Transcript_35987:313-777(-)